MPEDDKKVRGRKKALVTRAINSIDRYAVEDNLAKVKEEIDRLMKAFEEFENAHFRYHDALEDDAVVEESDQYFDQVQKDYIAKMKYAKEWVRDKNGDANDMKEEKSKVSMQSQLELVSMMNLPKVEIEKFDGNPLSYHSFIALFDEVVDRAPTDNRVKLTRLIDCTKGEANKAIRFCILQKDDSAYQDARDILASRFGSDHMVSDRAYHSKFTQRKPCLFPPSVTAACR